MKILDLCRREVVTIDASAPLQRAAALMAGQHVGALAVVKGDGDQELVGIVTDRDLALDGLGRAGDPRDLQVGHIAKSPAVVLRPQASLADAATLMKQEGVRRLLVVDEESVVRGLVSFDDIAGELSAELESLVGALGEGVRRQESQRHVVPPVEAVRITFPGFGPLAMQ